MFVCLFIQTNPKLLGLRCRHCKNPGFDSFDFFSISNLLFGHVTWHFIQSSNGALFF